MNHNDYRRQVVNALDQPSGLSSQLVEHFEKPLPDSSLKQLAKANGLPYSIMDRELRGHQVPDLLACAEAVQSGRHVGFEEAFIDHVMDELATNGPAAALRRVMWDAVAAADDSAEVDNSLQPAQGQDLAGLTEWAYAQQNRK